MHFTFEQFLAFTSPLEGVVTSLYVDVNGAKVPPVSCVTTAIGCLVDPVNMAIPLQWVMPDGSAASANEIARQWRIVKADAARLSKLHWKYAAALTTIRLTDAGVLNVVSQRLLANEKVLRGYFPNWDLFPADAQLACCSMAWAIGAGWPHIFGNLRSACNAQNWIAAVASCDIRSDGNAGVIPRNRANKLCFANAAAVVAQNLPLDVLHWPGTTPEASQRDQALQVEADEAAKAHAEALDKLTSDALASLDLRADHDAPDFS